MRAVLREAWGIYRRQWLDVVRLTAAFYGALALVTTLSVFALGPLGIITAIYLWLASVFWVQAPLATLVNEVRDGTARVGVRRTLDAIGPRWGTISAAGLLAALGVYLASWLLVVPGLILLTRWSLLVPTITVENAGVFWAFGRSTQLVRGHGGRVFFGLLLSFVALFVVLAAAAAAQLVIAAAELGDAPTLLLGVAASVVILSLTMPVIALAWIVTYFRLRETAAREGVPMTPPRTAAPA